MTSEERNSFLERFFPEWPEELPDDEAVFVCEKLRSAEDIIFLRRQRKHLLRLAAAFRRAEKSINDFYQADVINLHLLGFTSRLPSMHQGLKAAADFCEQTARAKRGKPPDEAIPLLIHSKYRNNQELKPGQRGSWKD